MSNKLRNIDAIKKMLDGNHKTQSRKTVSFSDVKMTTDTTHAVGDVWTDENGVEWEQRNGFKIKKGKLDELRTLIAVNSMPKDCPKCGKEMRHRNDIKFWKLEKHCFDCQVAFEHELRIEGKYEEYQKQKVYENAMSWLKDAEQEAKDIIAAFRNPLSFADVEGNFEKWSGGKTADEVAEQIEKEFELFKQNFIEKYKPED